MRCLKENRLPPVLTLTMLLLTAFLGVAVAQGELKPSLRTVGHARPAQLSDYDLSWWTVDSGGDTLAGGEYTLGSTTGQPDAAMWTGGGYTLAGGFWGGVAVEYRVYLPLVLRDS